jgi:PfaD family protein
MKTTAYYITEKGNFTFDPSEFYKFIYNIRTPLHVIYEGDKKTPGLATGGEISSSNKKGIPLIASLPAIYPEWLGDRSFLETHNVRFAYTGGAMAGGIASSSMVIELARCGMMGFLGSGGMNIEEIEKEIKYISDKLDNEGLSWGVNLIHSPQNPSLEEKLVELYLKYGVRRISAAAFTSVTPHLVRFAVKGLYRDNKGFIRRKNYIFAKISHPLVARYFISPPPEEILKSLVSGKKITSEEAELAEKIPLCEDIDIEGSSGGHTDDRPLNAIFPVILSLCNEISDKYKCNIRAGAAGGIGTPHAVASAFAMGASHIVVGSAHQSSIEAGTSGEVKELLGKATVTDVMMTVSADMFEMGSKIQVLKRGTMMGVRGNILYDIYKNYNSIEDIPKKTVHDIEKNIFGMPLQHVWEKTKDYFTVFAPEQVQSAQIKEKHKMALIFKWYLGNSSQWAIQGQSERRLDYQIWCSPAMGAFNDWVKGTFLENQEKRKIKQIALNLMEGGAIVTRAHQLRNCGVPVKNNMFLYRPEVLDVN